MNLEFRGRVTHESLEARCTNEDIVPQTLYRGTVRTHTQNSENF